MLKCQFHIHAQGDAKDFIPYSPQDLIKEAVRLGYDAISITSHDTIIFSKHLQKYAQKKGLILFSGIEKKIEGKEILAINIDEKIHNVATFEELREYKNTHPDCLIIAPHPFFPLRCCLKKKLSEYMDIFDAIEYSYFYTKAIDFNKKAVEFSKNSKKPLIANSDCHILKYLDASYSLIDSAKNPLSIIKAIKNGKIKNISAPISISTTIKIFGTLMVRVPKKLLENRKQIIPERKVATDSVLS